MNIAGVIKDWMLIFFSFYLFHAPVTRLNLFGYAFCCSGVAIYNYQKLQVRWFWLVGWERVVATDNFAVNGCGGERRRVGAAVLTGSQLTALLAALLPTAAEKEGDAKGDRGWRRQGRGCRGGAATA